MEQNENYLTLSKYKEISNISGNDELLQKVELGEIDLFAIPSVSTLKLLHSEYDTQIGKIKDSILKKTEFDYTKEDLDRTGKRKPFQFVEIEYLIDIKGKLLKIKKDQARKLFSLNFLPSEGFKPYEIELNNVNLVIDLPQSISPERDLLVKKSAYGRVLNKIEKRKKRLELFESHFSFNGENSFRYTDEDFTSGEITFNNKKQYLYIKAMRDLFVELGVCMASHKTITDLNPELQKIQRFGHLFHPDCQILMCDALKQDKERKNSKYAFGFLLKNPDDWSKFLD